MGQLAHIQGNVRPANSQSTHCVLQKGDGKKVEDDNGNFRESLDEPKPVVIPCTIATNAPCVLTAKANVAKGTTFGKTLPHTPVINPYHHKHPGLQRTKTWIIGAKQRPSHRNNPKGRHSAEDTNGLSQR